MRRFMPYLLGPIATGLGGFSVTAILILARHALVAASPLT